jgi:DNA-binding NtrC family response regulator
LEWTGNVRELRNMAERLVIISPGNTIDGALLEMSRGPRTGEVDDIVASSHTFQEFKDRAERAYIKHMLELNNWNISKTAEAIDIQRSHLYSKMKKYGLERGAPGGEDNT